MLLSSLLINVPREAAGAPAGEFFGPVITEAMARSKPVLAIACHRRGSIVVDGEAGYLHPVGATDALTRHLRQAIHGSDRTAKGIAGYERVKARYLPHTVGARLVVDHHDGNEKAQRKL